MGWPSGARLLVALVVALVHAALLCALVTARIPHADLRALEPREIRAALGEKAKRGRLLGGVAPCTIKEAGKADELVYSCQLADSPAGCRAQWGLRVGHNFVYNEEELRSIPNKVSSLSLCLSLSLSLTLSDSV